MMDTAISAMGCHFTGPHSLAGIEGLLFTALSHETRLGKPTVIAGLVHDNGMRMGFSAAKCEKHAQRRRMQTILDALKHSWAGLGHSIRVNMNQHLLWTKCLRRKQGIELPDFAYSPPSLKTCSGAVLRRTDAGFILQPSS